MYEVKTEELLPLVEEWRLLRLEANILSQQVDESRDNFLELQNKLDKLNHELANLNATINYCIDNDTDPVHAKLSLSSRSTTNNNKKSRLVSRSQLEHIMNDSKEKRASKPGLIARLIQAFRG